jgi:hypothetical protein
MLSGSIRPPFRPFGRMAEWVVNGWESRRNPFCHLPPIPGVRAVLPQGSKEIPGRFSECSQSPSDRIITMKRPIWTVLLVIALGMAAFGSWLIWVRSPLQINRAAYEQIQKGMSFAEVELILGGPPGDYCSGKPFVNPIPSLADWVVEVWISDQAIIIVFFNPDGLVVDKTMEDMPSECATPVWQRFWNRIGW